MEVEPLEVAAWELVLDEVRAEELPGLAVDALLRGVDAPTLSALAGQPARDVRTSRDLFRLVLEELGIELPSHDAAVWNLVRSSARAIVEGSLSVDAGVQRIERWAWPLSIEDSGDLRVFVALADELAEHPEARAELEHHTRIEAEALLQRPRPRVWIKLYASDVGPALTRTVGHNSSDLDPKDLAISDDLRDDLAGWSDQHAAVMAGWPDDGGFDSLADAEHFVAVGGELVSRLQHELGPGHQVEYVPEAVRPPGVRLRSDAREG